MATVDSGNQKKNGRSRSLNFDLNLVPFIDLLSMCICFLLMTAVWMQLASMKVHQSLGTSNTQTSNLYDIDIEFTAANSLKMEIKNQQKLVKREELRTGTGDELIVQAKARLNEYQTKNGVGTLLVTPHREVNYAMLIHFFDEAKDVGITNFGVVPVRDHL